MKFIFIFIFLSVIIKNANSQYSKVSSLDSFKHSYKKLDSILHKNYFDTSDICSYYVHFMERLTNIKAHSDGNYFGWYYFTKADLKLWKNWYRINKKIRKN